LTLELFQDTLLVPN